MDTLEGYFIPPTTGNYVFFVCGDDEYYLYLSTDDSPANMYQICAEPGGWSDARNWTNLHSGDTTTERSDQNAGTAWPSGNVITLNAGQKYYMMSVHHDHSWSGGDYHGVTYKKDTDPDPAVGSAPTLTGSVVGYYFNPEGATLTFSENPRAPPLWKGSGLGSLRQPAALRSMAPMWCISGRLRQRAVQPGPAQVRAQLTSRRRCWAWPTAAFRCG